jgi:two-component system, LytTR family, sensor kinase
MVYGRNLTGGLKIRDVVNLEAVQSIQDTFAETLGFAALIVDRDASPVTRPSCFVPLCKMIRTTNVGLERCRQCDLEGGRLSQKSGGPEIYNCLGGLVDVAAPIIVNGEYLGSVHCGQVIPLNQREDYVETVLSRNSKLGLNQESLFQAVNRVPAVSPGQIQAAAKLLFLLSNYIVEMGVTNLTQAKLLEETQKQAALQMELNRSHLNRLEAQINPHFLFNTLSLIGYLAIQEGATQTEEVACCLGDLLRHSLRHIGKQVSLGEEVDIIRRYLNIQRLRFGDRLVVDIEIDPWINAVEIPCMVIQPLVENAIVHAVEPIERVVHVVVSARDVTGGVLVEICDDGAGMEEEMVRAIRNRKIIKSPEAGSIGLQNVLDRLEIEFGQEFRFEVNSEMNQGTCVRLFLPIDKPLRPRVFFGGANAGSADR